MALALADKALAAFKSSDYPTAISLYSQALSINPEAPDYYLKRSTSYQRTGQHELALKDAEIAVSIAAKRGKRELLGSAQLRRGIPLFLMGRYGDAGFCFRLAEQRCAGGEKNSVEMWRRKVEIALEDVEEGDLGREVTVAEVPEVVIPAAEVEKKVTATVAPKTDQAVTGKVTTPKEKIRHEWYQTPMIVVLTMYVKGVQEKESSIEIGPRSVSISFPLATGSTYDFSLDPLFAEIEPAESSYKIFSTKIEVKLKKKYGGQKWGDLEGKAAEDTVETQPTPTEKKESTPLYPSSSKSGSKDWDKVAAELSKKEKKGKDKESGDGPDFDDSDTEGDPVNHFFKKLYKDADPDTRRAMMKSYIESNGTALSTNWGEVSKGKVETSPPDGMVAKTWDEK